jgi:hypothetical protein
MQGSRQERGGDAGKKEEVMQQEKHARQTRQEGKAGKAGKQAR